MTHITHAARSCTPLTHRQRQVGVRLLLTNTFLMNLGYLELATVIALHFTHDLFFTAGAVGLALAMRALMQQGLDIFGGFFADRVGYRTSITMGFMVRGLAFVGMGFAQTLPQLILACLFIGLAGMFFDAASSGALAAMLPTQRRGRTFAIQATLTNAGASLGPLVGIAIYARYGFLPDALLAAIIFWGMGIATFTWLPEGIQRRLNAGDVHLLTLPQLWQAITQRRSYVRVVLLLMGYWAINGQLTLTVPLAVAHLYGKNGVAILLSLSAILAIPLQYPLVRLVERWLPPVRLLAVSTLLTGVGLAMIFLAPVFAWQIAGIVVATIGSLAATPTMATLTAQVAPQRAIAAFYGFSAIGIGVGGAIGQFVGGSLYDMQFRLHLPWLMALVVVAVGVGIGYALLRTAAPGVITANTDTITEAGEDLAARSGVMAAV